MFAVTVYCNEDDFGGMAGTEVTVYDGLDNDTDTLVSTYGEQMINAPRGTSTDMVCDTCDTTVLIVERGVFGTPIITEFRPFGVDDGDNGSGVIQCALCLLRGASLGQQVIGRDEEGKGAHRAA